MLRFFVAVTLLLTSLSATAQVRQSGNVTPKHVACWTTTGVIMDCGTAANALATSFGTTGQGPTICANSAPFANSYNQLCLSTNTSSAAQIILQSYNGASQQDLQFVINGVVATFPTPSSPLPVASGGTGATTAAGARTNLGLGTMAVQNANAVAITGGNITGMANPVASTDVANKAYVDLLANGYHVLGPSTLATAAVLPNSPTYSNGSSGVGATLTAGSNTTLTVDGTAAPLNTVVLVKNQVAPAQNGQFYVSAAGSGSVPWVLTRCTAAACGIEFDSAATMLAASYAFVSAGATNLNTAWVLSATVTTPGTTAATFYQVSGASASQWTTSGSNIYYNTGNVGIGTASPSNPLHVVGSPRFSSLGAGIGTLGATGVVSSTKSYTTSIVYAADYGVVGDNSTNNNSTLQNAITACSTFPASGSGCILQLPCGRVLVSTGFSATYGIIIQGCGAGQNRVYDPDVPLTVTVGGTVVVQSCTACDTFSVVTTNSVQFRDFGIDAPLNATAGSLIRIRAAASVPDNVRVRNWHSIISNMDLVGGWDQVTMEFSNAYSIRDSSFRSPANDGVVLTNPGIAPTYEAGDARVYSNIFWVLLDNLGPNIFPFGGNCISMYPQSGMQIFANKMLGCKAGVEITAAPTGGGNVQIFSNNMEELHLYGVHLSQGVGTATFGGLNVYDNHITGCGSCSTFAIGIYVAAGNTPGYTLENMIFNNYINVSQGVSGSYCMYFADGPYTKVTGNKCRIDNPGTLPNGIAVTGNTSQVELLYNTIAGVVAPAQQYALTTPTVVVDLNGMTVAAYGATNFTNSKAGSTILFTDGKASSWPSNPALTNGGSGCVATAGSTATFQCGRP